MTALITIAGCILILTVLWDAFETIVLPRRVTRRIRLTRLFYYYTWKPWSALARRMRHNKRRDSYVGVYGPLSLIVLISIWAIGLVIGFALLQWAHYTKLNVPEAMPAFGVYLYMSGVTFFTLGFGDVAPVAPLGRFLSTVEAGMGFGFLALVIGYLPVLYQAFSRREVNISLLDARSGSPSSPTELLRRHAASGSMNELGEFLRDWERWAAELMESHLSYPVLCYFRSQHDNQSWLVALTTVLDTCALVMVGIDGAPVWQASLTFAIARHAVVDLTQIFYTPPVTPQPDRLPPADLSRLRLSLAAAGIPLRDGAAADQKLLELRRMYEPYVYALAQYLFMPLPVWILQKDKDAVDNWQTSAWERRSAGVTTSTVAVGVRDEEHSY
ncbi:MAG: potassium channel family protein [Pyrinomonadaceae bacterium]